MEAPALVREDDFQMTDSQSSYTRDLYEIIASEISTRFSLPLNRAKELVWKCERLKYIMDKYPEYADHFGLDFFVMVVFNHMKDEIES